MSELSETFAPGDPVTWLLRPKGSRSPIIVPVEGEVLRLTPKRVWIQITMRDGSQQKRMVKPENLRHRKVT